MQYLFKKIIHNTKKNFAVYVVIALEFALGLSIFLGCQSIMFKVESDLAETEAKMNAEEVRITYSNIEIDEYAIEFPYESYLETKEKFKNVLELRYAPYDSQPAFLIYSEEEYDYVKTHIYFINDEFFEAIFHTQMDHSKAYVGEKFTSSVSEMLKKNSKNYTDLTLHYPITALNEKELILFGDEVLGIEPTPKTERTYMDTPLQRKQDNDKYRAPISDAVFVSVDLYPRFEQIYKDNVDEFIKNPPEEANRAPSGNPTFCISISYPEGKYNTDTLPMLLNYLNSDKNSAIFSAGQEDLSAQNNVQNIKNSLNNYQLASIGLLVIVIVGNIGIILLFINRRKKAIAVSCAYGATLKRIAAELFAELALVILFGTVLAFGALHFAKPLLQTIYGGTQVQPWAVWVALDIALITVAVPTVAAVFSLKKLSVTETLKSN